MKSRVQTRGEGKQEDSKVPMAAMIDVVFLLLVFFVLTVRPVDVLAHLDANQSGGRGGSPGLKVDVLEDGYRLNGRPVTVRYMDDVLVKLGALDGDQAVMIACEVGSAHEGLLTALDLCAKAGLNNLSVVSR